MNKSEVFQRLFNKEKTLDLEIKNVSINSRELEKNDVFVAIRGGNNFVNEALEKGAVVVYDSEAVKIDEKYVDKILHLEENCFKFISIKDYNMRNLLLVDCIKVEI